MLMIGIYRHGLGNWEAICADRQLGFRDKISLGEEDEGKAKPSQLKRRCQALIRALMKPQKGAWYILTCC